MEILETTDEVIDALGGINSFCRLTNRSQSWVYRCKGGGGEGRFPGRPELFFIVTNALAERGKRASLMLWKAVPPDALCAEGTEIPGGESAPVSRPVVGVSSL